LSHVNVHRILDIAAIQFELDFARRRQGHRSTSRIEIAARDNARETLSAAEHLAALRYRLGFGSLGALGL
jgi:hypothetical protein